MKPSKKLIISIILFITVIVLFSCEEKVDEVVETITITLADKNERISGTILTVEGATATEIWNISDTLVATLYDNNVLVISGTGNMPNYGFAGLAPWLDEGMEEVIEKVIIEEGVTSIGDMTFLGCISLESITIPNSVTNIGDDAFFDCSSVTEIEVNENNINYKSIDGVLFNKGKTTLIKYPEGKVDTSYEIPSGVKSIGIDAFSYCKKLESITIPNSVTTIGESAFYYCSGLKSITVEENSNLESIGDSAFASSGLTSIKIPDSVTTIGERAFSWCSSLKSITIPNSVTSIGDSAFASSGLTSIKIPDSVTSIGDYGFYGCSSLTSITIPDSITSIRYYAFSDCSSLTSITIPDSVTSIGERAFSWCSSLKSITFEKNSKLESIGVDAFSYCKKLESITIPDNVTRIGNSAFNNCKKLTSINIPEGVTSIGESVFASSGLTSITIPDSITSIGKGAFSYCSSLTEIEVNENNKNYKSANGVLFNKEETTLIKYPKGKVDITEYTIPDSVTRIEDSAFYDCSGLTSITIPDGVTSIGTFAFPTSGLESIKVYCGSDAEEYVSNNKNYRNKLSTIHYIVNYDAQVATCEGIGWEAYEECSSCSYTTKVEIPALGHDYEAVVTAPTCETAGYTTHTCTRCGDSYKNNETQALNHQYGEWTVKTQATCTQDGLKERSCSKCSKTETQVVTKYGHSYETKVTAPTCEEAGERIYTCKNDASHTYTERISATGHKYKVKESTEAVCEQGGKIIYECENCEDSYEETIPVLGHTLGEVVIENKIEATCTKKGSYDNVVYCTVCKKELTRETKVIEKIEHNYEEQVIEPTCEEGGYTIHTCTKCGDNYRDNEIPALGHDIESHEAQEATCGEKGWKAYEKCNRCNYTTYEEIPALGHTEVIDAAVEATCTSSGLTEGKHCSVCEEVLIAQEEIAALEHNYKEKVTKPTCEERGYTTHTCTRCSDSYTDTYVEALGHDYGEGTITKEATCTQKGWTIYEECSRCKHTAYEEFEALGHNYEEVVTAPTCEERGYTTHTCTRCRDSYKDTYVQAIGHNYGEWTIEKEPTYEEEGKKYRICTNCNEEREEERIPVLEKEEVQVETEYEEKEQEGQKFAVMSKAEKVEEILENITSNKELEIVDKTGKVIEDTAKVGTGAKVIVKETKEEVYTIVVKGDINGDGTIDFVSDILAINNYRIGIGTLETEQNLAADIDGNGKIDFVSDILAINNYRIGITNRI